MDGVKDDGFRCIWDKEEDAVAFRCAPLAQAWDASLSPNAPRDEQRHRLTPVN